MTTSRVSINPQAVANRISFMRAIADRVEAGEPIAKIEREAITTALRGYAARLDLYERARLAQYSEGVA